MKLCQATYEYVISLPNLFRAWQSFKCGKSKKLEVRKFWLNLENNLFSLHKDLRRGTYEHGDYERFIVFDPKRRVIHKSQVRDRVVHQLIYHALYYFYDDLFIAHSYSCRLDKGTHKAVLSFEKFLRLVSQNYKNKFFAFQGDITKFFDSVDQEVLKLLLTKRIKDQQLLSLLNQVIESYESGKKYSQDSKNTKRGLPLGNLTSQLFNNIYLHELDVFVKEQLKVKHYLRYADDFAIVSDSKEKLSEYQESINQFLKERLNLELNSRSGIRLLVSGIDWLGYRFYPTYKIVKPRTVKRFVKSLDMKIQDYSTGKINSLELNETWQSYLGHLKWANSNKLFDKLATPLAYNYSHPELFQGLLDSETSSE